MPSPSPKPEDSETSSTELPPEAQQPPEKQPGRRTKFQTGTVETIERKLITLAKYNPQKASGDALRRLRKNIKTVGIVGPALVWNKRTGNLVSGHKRLAQLDILEGDIEYVLDVTVVDWPLRKEKQQNVFFNNRWAQGDFDLELLGEMVAEDLSALEGMGLDPVEIQTLFPDDPRFGELFKNVAPELSTMPDALATLNEIEAGKTQVIVNNQQARAAAAEAQRAENTNAQSTSSAPSESLSQFDPEEEARARAAEAEQRAEETRARRKELGAQLDRANASDFYITIVAENGEEASRVLQALGVAEMDTRFISAAKVLAALAG